MRRVNGILRQSQKALQDLDLLKVLQSEIRHEQSHDRFQVPSNTISNPASLTRSVAFLYFVTKTRKKAGIIVLFPWMQNYQGGNPGDFVVDWDSPASQDVVLRRKCESGEEVAVSALLSPITFRNEEGSFPRDLLMKVCVKKPGLSPVLQFDCGVFSKDHERLEFNIHSAYYIPSPACLNPSAYRGPSFRCNSLSIGLINEHCLRDFYIFREKKKKPFKYIIVFTWQRMWFYALLSIFWWFWNWISGSANLIYICMRKPSSLDSFVCSWSYCSIQEHDFKSCSIGGQT